MIFPRGSSLPFPLAGVQGVAPGFLGKWEGEEGALLGPELCSASVPQTPKSLPVPKSLFRITSPHLPGSRVKHLADNPA